MVRNALVAAGNSGDDTLVPAIVTLLDDESPVVRGAAIWALGQLDPVRLAAERAGRRSKEPDESVVAEWNA
jgi:epoxyqueuosine reductase